MIGTLLIIGRILRNQFKCNYLRNLKCFLQVSLRFWNLYKILNILKKIDEPHGLSISDILDSKKGRYLNV